MWAMMPMFRVFAKDVCLAIVPDPPDLPYQR